MCLRCALLDVLVVLVVIGVVLHRDVVRQRDAANGAHAVQDFERALMAIRLLWLARLLVLCKMLSALQNAPCLARTRAVGASWSRFSCWRRPIQL